MLPSAGGHNRRRLEDLAVDLTAKAHGLAGQLHPRVRAEVGVLVRSMNCYYSNLIEGHNTHPIDIERALRADYSSNTEKRVLQMEARAHIEVQALLDGPERAPSPGSMAPQLAPRSSRVSTGSFSGVCPMSSSGSKTLTPATRRKSCRVSRDLGM